MTPTISHDTQELIRVMRENIATTPLPSANDEAGASARRHALFLREMEQAAIEVLERDNAQKEEMK
jgi:hypothetical protein